MEKLIKYEENMFGILHPAPVKIGDVLVTYKEGKSIHNIVEKVIEQRPSKGTWNNIPVPFWAKIKTNVK